MRVCRYLSKPVSALALITDLVACRAKCSDGDGGDVTQEDVMDAPEMDRARRRSLLNVSPNWRASSSRESINVLHSRSQEIKKIDVLEFAGFANTQQN